MKERLSLSIICILCNHSVDIGLRSPTVMHGGPYDTCPSCKRDVPGGSADSLWRRKVDDFNEDK